MYIIILMTVYKTCRNCENVRGNHLNTCQLATNNIELKLNATDDFLMHDSLVISIDHSQIHMSVWQNTVPYF